MKPARRYQAVARRPGRDVGGRRPLGRVVVLGVTTLLLLATAPAGLPTAGAVTSKRYYVSLGDSYAAGYQPTRGITRNGYADQLVADEQRLGHRYQLVNFGCGGATTTSILTAARCPAPALHGASYGGAPQASAAEAFLRAHPGQIGFVTVSIGGNDLTMCAGVADPIGCVTTALAGVRANLALLASGLRADAGPAVPLIGLTYPDVILGQWVHPPVSRSLAQLSVTAFRALINPTLRETYATAGARFVDVTAATGAYVPLTRTVRLPPYGTVPTAVASVCRLTYYCALGDIHPKTAGYGVIARLLVAALRHG